MSYPAWPASLPRPERRTWQVQPQNARISRKSEAGPPAFRRRFSSVAKGVSLSVLLTRNQRAVFDQFYEQELHLGSGLFWMPDPTTEGWALMTAGEVHLDTAAGIPILLAGRWLCQFAEDTPAETLEGLEFRKSFQVWVMP